MPQFRKKPVVIDAFQWDCNARTLPIPDWASARWSDTIMRHPDDYSRLLIKTLEGDMTADNGDWIIRGVKGEVYPCKPDIFAATYDPA